jgi:alkaline phosphatase D
LFGVQGGATLEVMTLTRRRFLRRAAPLGILPFLPACERSGTLLGNGAFPAGGINPFQHGLASGDPLTDTVLLWTRVTPPADTPSTIDVEWRVGLDPALAQLVAQGTTSADPSRDFTVKVDVSGLSPGSTYYYDFAAFGVRSRVARTRTLASGAVERARIAVTCCANYPAGYFNAYRLVAERADLDVVLHLGDYLYEYGNGTFGDGTQIGRLPVPDRETVTLDDYRQRHAQYKLDPDLQEAHRQHPFIAIWDDHEVANNAYRDGAANHQPDSEGDWSVRKAAAMQAYFEWMPIREVVPGDTQRVYRQFAWGDLLDLIMLDARYQRDAGVPTSCDPALGDPDRSILGAPEESWLADALQASQTRGARWRVIGQQVMLGQLSIAARGCTEYPDQWDGYPFSRQRLLAEFADGISNVVVLTGDAHSSWAFDLAQDPFDAASYDAATGEGSLAVEFVAPGVTSPGPDGDVQSLLDTHPHLKFTNLDRRGYVLIDVTLERARAEWYFVRSVTEQDATEELGAVFETADGENRLRSAPEASVPRAAPPAPAP